MATLPCSASRTRETKWATLSRQEVELMLHKKVMVQISHFNLRNILFSSVFATLLLSGCEKREPVTYRVPKEERPVNLPTQQAAPSPSATSGPNNMQVLPGMEEAAAEAGDFTYTVPEGWEEFPPSSSVRKANFRIPGEGTNQAELTVTVFPGDVGGKLANINRWRSQIGMSPIGLADMSSVSRPFPISNHNGVFVYLQGEQQSILGGILDFHGFTWFFKMQGDKATVAQQLSPMSDFLTSVAIDDPHH